jgi:hypothetical protein
MIGSSLPGPLTGFITYVLLPSRAKAIARPFNNNFEIVIWQQLCSNSNQSYHDARFECPKSTEPHDWDADRLRNLTSVARWIIWKLPSFSLSPTSEWTQGYASHDDIRKLHSRHSCFWLLGYRYQTRNRESVRSLGLVWLYSAHIAFTPLTS